MDRFDLINLLIETFGFKSYLEIGVHNPKDNFDFIKAEKKVGVEPDPVGEVTFKMTADEFFAQNKEKFDIIFIDALHIDENVTRDISNSLACLTPDGIIVLHDCNPLRKEHQEVPAVVPYWVGTVWKAFTRLMQTLPPAVEMFVVDTDTGIGIIKATGKGIKLDFVSEADLTFENLELNRSKWLNLMSLDDFKTWIKPEPVKVTKAIAKAPMQSLEIQPEVVETKTVAKKKVDKLEVES